MLASKKREEFSIQVLQFVDASLVYAAFLVASWFRAWVKGSNADGYGLESVLWLVYLLVPAVPLLLDLSGFYNNLLRKKLSNAMTKLVQTFVVIGACIGGAFIVFKVPYGSRYITVIGMGFVFVAISTRFLITRFCVGSLTYKMGQPMN